MIFFTYFGIFAFVGFIICAFLVSKELKKELPTEEEKQELIKLGLIDSSCKDKKILRAYTQQLRVYRSFQSKNNVK